MLIVRAVQRTALSAIHKTDVQNVNLIRLFLMMAHPSKRVSVQLIESLTKKILVSVLLVNMRYLRQKNAWTVLNTVMFV